MKCDKWLHIYGNKLGTGVVCDEVADVRENVKGKWITANEQPYFRKHYNNVVCSVCHRKGDSRWNFCPNCGADMRPITALSKNAEIDSNSKRGES